MTPETQYEWLDYYMRGEGSRDVRLGLAADTPNYHQAQPMEGLAAITSPIREYMETPRGLAADMVAGGTVRYLDKLAKGERMDTMDYFMPALEVPGGVAVAGAKRAGDAVVGGLRSAVDGVRAGSVADEVVDTGRRAVTQGLGLGAAMAATGAYKGAGEVGEVMLKGLGKEAAPRAAGAVVRALRPEVKSVLAEATFRNHPLYLHPNYEEFVPEVAKKLRGALDDVRAKYQTRLDSLDTFSEEGLAVHKQMDDELAAVSQAIKEERAPEILEAMEKNAKSKADSMRELARKDADKEAFNADIAEMEELAARYKAIRQSALEDLGRK